MRVSDDDVLSERKKQILRAVVDAYISAGEPVGSKYLTQDAGIAFSSATVRNEMSELEEMGYLEQPHTSSGRIPSERGYRFYVDSLMDSYRMTAAELAELNRLAKMRVAKMDRLLSSAGKLMSAMTNYTSLTACPASRNKTVEQFRTVVLSADILLLIMVVKTGGVNSAETAYVPAPGITAEGAAIVEQSLNVLVSSLDAGRITLPIIMELRDRIDMCGCFGLSSRVVSAVYDVLNDNDVGELRFEGVNLLLRYPEYSDPTRLGGLLESLERKNELLSIISENDSDGVRVYIGSENGLDNMRSSSLIFKKIRLKNNVDAGVIGVVGPCRMKYNKVITMLEQFSKQLSDLMSDDIDEVDF